MRLFSILTLTTLLSAPAFAADLGTYRPGSPYHSVNAPGADVCESHCAGDAQCKSWNYVKVNPRAPGVCEFNTKNVSPIESAISISGAGQASVAPNLLQGNTNTVRVGTQVKPQPRSRAVTVGKRPSGRRIVREAVPQRVRPEQSSYHRPVGNGSLTAQQNKYRHQTGHVAPQGYPRQQGYPQIHQQQAARPQIHQKRVVPQGQRLIRDPRIQAPQQRKQDPRFQHNLDGGQQAPQNLMARPQTAPTQQKQTRAPQGRPPVGVPIGPQSNQQQPQQQFKAQAGRRTAPVPQQRAIPRGSVNDPVTHANGAQRVQAAAQRQAQMSVEQAQQSLFGSLNDDVQAPSALVALPSDPNAPVPTSQARPTQPVEQGSLGALVGGPRG